MNQNEGELVQTHTILQMIPYLVQRLTIKQRPNKSTALRFSQVTESDYMGSAEFEFGAIPMAYRAIASNLQFFRLCILIDFLNEKDQPLCVFTCFEGESWDKYLDQLKKMRDGKLRLKEGSRFEKNAYTSQYSNIDLWWDIRNQVIWSFDRKFMKNISFYLANSAKYISEIQAAERSSN